MIRHSFVLILVLIGFVANAQQVPSRMQFADLDLRLTNDAIKDIQSDVDAMTRSEKYFQKNLERVDMYMPIIERIFAEEGLPDDFKYLVIQESALVSDAVSSSNAVGFWQFKEISGLENDLRIDRHIDERINIVASTRAAATYLKSHNSYFDNWAHSLIAYQSGRYGAEKLIDKKDSGKKKLTITKNTYWYLKKFLAHKIAYENALGSSTVPYFLFEKTDAAGMHLKDIAKEYDIPLDLIQEYNKWIKRGAVPDDKTYAVIVPLEDAGIAENRGRKESRNPNKALPGEVNTAAQKKFPLVEGDINQSRATAPHEVKINGRKGILAAQGYTVSSLAEAGGISESKFRKFNDMAPGQNVNTGSIYYLQRKRNRAKFYYHTVMAGENMWEISQKYGLKLHKLYRKNRMESPAQPKPGRVLWLRLNRPEKIAVEYQQVPKEEVTEPKNQVSAEQPISEKIIETEKTLKPELKDTSKISTPIAQNIPEQNIALPDENMDVEELPEAAYVEEKNEEVIDDELESEEEKPVRQELMIYEIKKGDTFFSIANRFNMRISDLLEFNELNIRDTLSIGQKISVNKYNDQITENTSNNKDEEPMATNDLSTDTDINDSLNQIEHRVQAGETMYGLAKKYGTSLKEIMEWNGKSDYSLSEGDVILIKKK
ncbi:LysM peptidoglycan-binding domain-containing protein [Marivirga sp. S37H4]|uniref:LysM peptidoglycan-binding domain-containing protein n=1 Tax=Marivirga aurantiaca TaxID=2802615 RepID=A0A934WUX1_9BACT|nr:LysM peptidoglycan-binding domain-containing protein [Marivirga aurantiaca]MBK6263474.1 LysM peptidoglycan-binding domain-containing protein [Marivirga aurantiaca]